MWGPYVGLLPLSSLLLPPAAAARRPLVCASLHGPSSRPAMASELEQEAGRAPPPQIHSRPAGAAPERGRGVSRPRSEHRRHDPAPRRRRSGRELHGARAGAMGEIVHGGGAGICRWRRRRCWRRGDAGGWSGGARGTVGGRCRRRPCAGGAAAWIGRGSGRGSRVSWTRGGWTQGQG